VSGRKQCGVFLSTGAEAQLVTEWLPMEAGPWERPAPELLSAVACTRPDVPCISPEEEPWCGRVFGQSADTVSALNQSLVAALSEHSD